MKSTSLFHYFFGFIMLLLIQNSCSDDGDRVNTNSKEYTLVVYDNPNQEIRANYTFILWKVGLDQKLTSPVNLKTDKDGKVIIVLHKGKYYAEMAYISNGKTDNFYEFEVIDTNGDEIIIPLEDMRPYYDCSVLLKTDPGAEIIASEKVQLITLDANGIEIKTEELVTNNEGKLLFKMPEGKYRVKYGHIINEYWNNTFDFQVKSSLDHDFTMLVKPAYNCSLVVKVKSTQKIRQNEKILLITLDSKGKEIKTEEMTTDSEGKIHPKLVIGSYRVKFAYIPDGDWDNTIDFKVKTDESTDFVMEIKTNLLDDNQPIGYTYFEDSFSWIDNITFPGIEDYMVTPNTSEFQVIKATTEEQKAKLEDSKWEYSTLIYLRPGYLKFGSGSTTSDSKATITTPQFPIVEGKYSNVKVSFDVARYITKTGLLDKYNKLIIRITGSGSFHRTDENKSAEFYATNTVYNEWIAINAIIYNISSDTRISIESEPAIDPSTKKWAPCRLFLDNVKVIKESQSEKEK